MRSFTFAPSASSEPKVITHGCESLELQELNATAASARQIIIGTFFMVFIC